MKWLLEIKSHFERKDFMKNSAGDKTGFLESDISIQESENRVLTLSSLLTVGEVAWVFVSPAKGAA